MGFLLIIHLKYIDLKDTFLNIVRSSSNFYFSHVAKLSYSWLDDVVEDEDDGDGDDGKYFKHNGDLKSWL